VTKTQGTLGGILIGLLAGAFAGYCVGHLLYHGACGVMKGPMIFLYSIMGIPVGGVVFGLIGYWRGHVADPKAISGRRHFQCPECGGTVVVSWHNGIAKDCPHCSKSVRIPAAGPPPARS